MNKKVLVAVLMVIISISSYIAGYSQYKNCLTYPITCNRVKYNGDFHTALKKFTYNLTGHAFYDGSIVNGNDKYYKIVYIAVIDNDNIVFKEYGLKDKETLNIQIPEGKKFVVSIENNMTVLSNWEIQEIKQLNKHIIFQEAYMLEDLEFKFYDPKPFVPVMGYSESRRNFVFEAAKKGRSKLEFGYVDMNSKEIARVLHINVQVN